MIKKLLLFTALSFLNHLTVKASFNFNANCTEAYNSILSMKMSEAKMLIQKERQEDPKNGIIILLDNYVDFFSLLASDNKNEYERLKDTKSDRVSALEDNDANSPYYLYAQAEIYLQWGLLKGKYGDYLSSARDIKKASNLLKDNVAKYPDFLPNKKGLALINVIFGSIPSNLKTITQFLGMSGNVQSGIKQLETLRTELPRSKFSMYKDEVIFLLCYIDIDIQHNKNNYNKLITYLVNMDNGSMLKIYLEGYAAAKTAHNEEAISYLLDRPTSGQYISLPAIDYILGNAKLNRNDNDAPAYLNKYLKEYRGINFIKDTYLKLGYYYLLHNDTEKYEYYLKLVRSKGYAVDEKDKQALKEANDARPDIDLLRARFYFDGGYYEKALSQLKNKKQSDLKLARDKIELPYRLGRINEGLQRSNDAISNYQEAINLGKNTSYYYAANAALSMGKIYEQKRDINHAAAYYNQAINMKDHEYKSSIDIEAHDGLKRIGR